MTSKIPFILLLILVLICPWRTFAWNPAVSVLGSYTITKTDVLRNPDMFDLKSSKVNFGVELSNKFYLDSRYFIKTGLRYNQYSTSVSQGTQSSGAFSMYNRLSWKTGYESFTMPVLFGKDFTTKNGHKGDAYAGVSIGVITSSYGEASSSSGNYGNTSYSDTIFTNASDVGGQLSPSFFATADFGIRYQPFITAPRFSMGIMCAIQLSKTPAIGHEAIVSDSKGNAYTYTVQNSARYTNVALSLSYTFGKQRSADKSYMLPQ